MRIVLVTRDCIAWRAPEETIDRAVIAAQLSYIILNSCHIWVGRGSAIVNALVIVVGLNVRIVTRVVIVWIVVVGVVRVVIPGIEAVLETYPKASVPGPPTSVPE